MGGWVGKSTTLWWRSIGMVPSTTHFSATACILLLEMRKAIFVTNTLGSLYCKRTTRYTHAVFVICSCTHWSESVKEGRFWDLLLLLTEEILSITAGSDRGSYAKPLFVRALSSHSRVRESELSSWNNFFQSCRQGSNRGPSDKKATAKSTPPRGTHLKKFLDLVLNS